MLPQKIVIYHCTSKWELQGICTWKAKLKKEEICYSNLPQFNEDGMVWILRKKKVNKLLELLASRNMQSKDT